MFQREWIKPLSKLSRRLCSYLWKSDKVIVEELVDAGKGYPKWSLKKLLNLR
jgi:hypothetical protein